MHRFEFDRLSAALRRDRRRIALLTVIYTLTAPAAAVVLLKFLGRILTVLGAEDFGAVFEALRHAPMSGPIPFAVLVSLVCALLICLIRDAGRRKIAVLVGILLWILWFAGCLCVIEVNGIAFGRVLLSLLQGLQNGLADAL